MVNRQVRKKVAQNWKEPFKPPRLTFSKKHNRPSARRPFFGAFPTRHFSLFLILFEPFNEKKTPLFLLAGQGESITYKLPLFSPLSLSLDITRPYMASLGPNTSRWLEPNGLEQTPPFEQASNPVTSACCCRWRQRQGSYFFFLSSCISTYSHFFFFSFFVFSTHKRHLAGRNIFDCRVFFSFHDCGKKKKKKEK